MTKKVRYFLNSLSATNYAEFALSFDSFGVTLAGSEVIFNGTAQEDFVWVSPRVSLDFTKSSGGIDRIYFPGSFADYNLSKSGSSTLVIQNKASQAVSRVNAGSSSNYDLVVFPEGSVKSRDLFDSAVAPSPSIEFIQEVRTPIAPKELYPSVQVTAPVTVRAFAVGDEGVTFATFPVGQTSLVATGSAYVDTVYVAAYSSVDATKLSGGTDKIFLTGRSADYLLSTTGSSTLILARTNGTSVESIKVNAGSITNFDWVIFADGRASSKDLFDAAKTGGAIQHLINDDEKTPGLAPTLNAPALDGVANLDVSSNIVLTFSEEMAFVGGGEIRVVNDANGSGKTGYYGESVVNTLTYVPTSTEASQKLSQGSISISGNKLIINPSRDLDFSNNYHIEISGATLRGKTSGLNFAGISNTTDLNFSTVTPSQDKDVTKLDQAGGLSQKFDSQGALVSSFVWKDSDSWPSAGKTQQLPEIIDLGSRSIALVIGDHNSAVATETTTNVATRNFHLQLVGFGVDDVVYVDDLGRNEDATYALKRIFTSSVLTDNQVDLIAPFSSDFDFNAASSYAGGRLTIADQNFGSLDDWITLLGTTASNFPLGAPIVFG